MLSSSFMKCSGVTACQMSSGNVSSVLIYQGSKCGSAFLGLHLPISLRVSAEQQAVPALLHLAWGLARRAGMICLGLVLL